MLQRARRGGAAVCGAADEKGGVSPADAAPPAVRRTNEEPPWVRRERERELQAAAPKELPFGVYLLLSVIVAIAAVRFCLPVLLTTRVRAYCCSPAQTGSIFEFGAQNPIFGVLGADSPLYTPILGLFVLTGFPMARLRLRPAPARLLP